MIIVWNYPFFCETIRIKAFFSFWWVWAQLKQADIILKIFHKNLIGYIWPILLRKKSSHIIIWNITFTFAWGYHIGFSWSVIWIVWRLVFGSSKQNGSKIQVWRVWLGWQMWGTLEISLGGGGLQIVRHFGLFGFIDFWHPAKIVM